MKNILMIHHSSELYGSDKVFLSIVKCINRNMFRPIVILPKHGILSDLIEREGIRVYFSPLARIERNLLSLRRIPIIGKNLVKSLFGISRIEGVKRVDFIYSSSLHVLSGAIWAVVQGKTHVWHVHEIVEHPHWVRQLLPKIAVLLSKMVITNSLATSEWFREAKPNNGNKIRTIWNGYSRTRPRDDSKVAQFRKLYSIHDGEVLITLVGRIHRWKGQQLLLEACELMYKKGVSNFRILLVGGSPHGQEHFSDSLKKNVQSSCICDQVILLEFSEDITTIWDVTDIAVVPSTEPEPFGMVALEAMAAMKPVVGANHGGLREIILHESTGLLFPPRDVAALARALTVLIHSKEKRIEMGKRGLERQREFFSEEQFIHRIEQLYDEI
jgi:glycosyltransferase involved in cell wall biosynthesis